jgi:hypothetical protein
MEPVCRRAQRALIAGEVPPDLEEHIQVCERCGRARRLSEFLVARSRGAATGTIDRVFTPGQELVGYRLENVVGSGGQGVVFKATEVDVPGSVVALKIVHMDRADASVWEVSYGKRINHPNVCRVNTTKVHGNFRLIEMEFVEGGTLASRLTAPMALSDTEKGAVFRGVLDGLDAVHKKSVLHLDLKPTNILLRDSTSPVVTDFGMSAQTGGEGVGGTRGWSAPEVSDGGKPDVRADVYSAGALLSALYPDPSDGLGEVIARARAARREDRFENVSSLRAAFDAAIRSPDQVVLADPPAAPRVVAPPSPAPERRVARIVGVALGVVGLVGVAATAAIVTRPRSLGPAETAALAKSSTASLDPPPLGPGYELLDTIDFRSFETGVASPRTDAAPYLLKHGLTIVGVSPPESHMVLEANVSFYDGRGVSGPPDVSSLTQEETGYVPASYTLVLATPVDRVDVTLPGLIAATEHNGITHPAWSAHALDEAGNELSAHSEALQRYFKDVPPRTYTLEAPAPELARIVRVRFDSDPRLHGKPFAAFRAVLVERIVLSRRR